MDSLYDPGRHVALAEIPWDADHARAGINAIVADTRAAASPEGLWPIHPDDGPPEWGSLVGLYFGAVGVIWGLDYLQRIGAADEGPNFGEHLEAMEARNAPFAERFAAMVGGYLLGQSGVLFTRWRLRKEPEVLDRLAALIAGTIDSPALELMWGSPGVMLIALTLLAETGEARWATLIRACAKALDDAFGPDEALRARIWTQELYGAKTRYLGAVHGFAGNAFVLNRARALMTPEVWGTWRDRLAQTFAAGAVRAGPLANWPPKLDPPAEEAAPPLLVQHCHGAAGMVTSLADVDAPIDDLLVAGGEMTWRAGPLSKGSNLCHGTAGNGYAFLKLFQRTGDQIWLDRARAFAMHALAQSETQAAALGRRRYSLWTGDLGVACYLWDCLQAKARFPTLDVL